MKKILAIPMATQNNIGRSSVVGTFYPDVKVIFFLFLYHEKRGDCTKNVFKYIYSSCITISANTLTEDPDIRIIRISEPEASDPYYSDIRIIRVIRISELSVLSGYSNYPGIRIRISF